MQKAAVFGLQDELAKAKRKANDELEELKSKLPKEVCGNVKVTDLGVERLAFAKNRGFAIVKAKGKMSAQIQP